MNVAAVTFFLFMLLLNLFRRKGRFGMTLGVFQFEKGLTGGFSLLE